MQSYIHFRDTEIEPLVYTNIRMKQYLIHFVFTFSEKRAQNRNAREENKIRTLRDECASRLYIITKKKTVRKIDPDLLSLLHPSMGGLVCMNVYFRLRGRAKREMW